MTPEQAKAAADMLATVWEGEFPATCAVLAAVKDDNRGYKPDAKSRTAWELATHLATADIWFIDSITKGAFEWNPKPPSRPSRSSRASSDVVAFYKQTFPGEARGAACAPGREVDRDAGLLRHDEDAARAVHRLRQQPQHPSSRSAGGLPAGDGLEGAEHLRPERGCRRAQ